MSPDEEVVEPEQEAAESAAATAESAATPAAEEAAPGRSEEELAALVSDPEVIARVLQSDSGRSVLERYVDDVLNVEGPKYIERHEETKKVEAQAADARKPWDEARRLADEEGDYSKFGELAMKALAEQERRKPIESEVRNAVLAEETRKRIEGYEATIETFGLSDAYSRVSADPAMQQKLHPSNFRTEADFVKATMAAVKDEQARIDAEARGANKKEQHAETATRARAGARPVLPGGDSRQRGGGDGQSLRDYLLSGTDSGRDE